jgi:hypothetical protein
MKCLAFLAIIIFGLAQQPAKTSVPEKTNAAVQTEAALHADQKPSGEDLKVQHQLARFTGLLVLVGFLQLIALVGQACLFFRQARIMGQHRVSLEQLAEAASDNALIEAREVRNGRRLSLRLSQDDINNITHNKSFVHFRGFIKYRDIFEKTLSKTIASDPHKHWFGAPTLEMLEKCSFLTQIVP